MESIWTKDIKIPEFPTVEQDMKVDVLVVGGGMCGLLAGHFLKEQGGIGKLEKLVILKKSSFSISYPVTGCLEGSGLD